MLAIVRRHLPVAITAAIVCSVFTGGPSVAKAAFDAVNSDKVDGKDAVASGASVAQRKGKLVATSGVNGRLPNNIIAKAPNSEKLDGLDGTAYRVTGHGKVGSTVNVDSCGAGPVASYPVHLTRSARIFATAASGYGRSNPGPESPSIRIQLLDAANTVVAQSSRTVVVQATGNPALTISGVLLKPDGSEPFDAVPGTYMLRVLADNFGSCTGFGQYQSPELTHVELAAGD
jgi:hypothetical protein